MFLGGKRNEVREKLANILNGSLELNPVTIPDLFPKFLKVTNKGQASYVNMLASKEIVPSNFLYLYFIYFITRDSLRLLFFI